jgi:hypothetical protein
MQSRQSGRRSAARAAAVPVGFVSSSGIFAGMNVYGDGSGCEENASYMGVASSSKSPSGLSPRISSIVRMKLRKS